MNHADTWRRQLHENSPEAAAAALPATRSVAMVMSPALGDTLNLLVIAHNLARAGWQVAVYGNQAFVLAEWFPHLSISPALTDDESRTVLSRYRQVIQMHRDRPLKQLCEWHPGFIDLHDVGGADTPACMATRYAEFAAARFDLPDVEVSNGLQPPAELTYRKFGERVAIHPEASTPDKRWLPLRFIGLSRQLRAQGLRPEFVIASAERARWTELAHASPPMHSFPSTASLAAWLYESGWFIGNDSGVGHLASALGIPTLTVFRRRRVAMRWRPGFHAGDIVLPAWWLPTAALKERWWRESITVKRVLRAFQALQSRVAPPLAQCIDGEASKTESS